MPKCLHPPPLSLFANIGEWQTFSPGLSRLTRALEYLINPHQQYPHIVVGGTNGKGTVSYQLAQCAPGKVGLLTSPHLLDIRERITIDQKIVEDLAWHDAYHVVCQHIPNLERQFSYFEWIFLLAVVIFQRQHVDWAIFEVGLGGRLDACNTLDPQLSLLTSVGLDHTQILGDTIKDIACEKVAIARANRPMVLGQSVYQLPQVRKQLDGIGAHVMIIDDETLTVTQQHQALVSKVCQYFSWPMPLSLVSMPGRKEILKRFGHAPIYIDCAHNPQAWQETCAWLTQQPDPPKVMITSLSASRTYKALLAQFQPIIPEIRLWLSGFENELPADAWPNAIQHIKTEQLETYLNTPLLICGSMYMVGNWLKWYTSQVESKISTLHPLLEQILKVQPKSLECR